MEMGQNYGRIENYLKMILQEEMLISSFCTNFTKILRSEAKLARYPQKISTILKFNPTKI